MNNLGDAVAKTTGPCVILAGAGTGKTHSIVEKIKYLIENGIYKPERIVCITFSNEAANSLLVRVQRALNLGEGKEPVIRTFHAFSGDLIRKHGQKIGINQDFKILEPDDAKVILHRNLKVVPYYCHKYIESIGTAKDLGITLEQLQNYVNKRIYELKCLDIEGRLEELQFELQTLHLKKDEENKKRIVNEIRKINTAIGIRKFVNAWSAYEKIKQKTNYQDYSDLNKNALDLLKKFPEVAYDYDYIIVDEFQDTNKIQLDFLVSLTHNKNITVVGDLNQSIYRFRGAYKDNFNLFKKSFNVQEKDVFTLAKSRRSSNKILRTAHKLILNNYDNKEDCFFVENYESREGDEIDIYELKNAREEARKIVELVQKEISEGKQTNEICIMFRTHQQGRIIKRALEMSKIEYVSVSKSSLLKNKDVKKVIYYLTILDKLNGKKKGGEDAWWGLIYELGFPEADLMKIGKFMKDQQKSREQNGNTNNNAHNSPSTSNHNIPPTKELNNNGLVDNDNELISFKLFTELPKLDLSGEGRMLAKVLIERVNSLLPLASKDVTDLIIEVFKTSGLLKDEESKEEKESTLNLNKFYELAKTHSGLYGNDLASFINYLDVIESLGIEIESAEIENSGVRLMTLHSTKGLEYKTVIVSNIAQKRFPIERIYSNPLIPLELAPEFSDLKYLSRDELEEYSKEYERKHQLLEERRLCYVAFTRAKDKLILTYANDYGGKKHYPSQFLNEIEYRTNKDIIFKQDLEEKFAEPEKDKEKEGKSDFSTALQAEKIDKRKAALSPSALLLFADCQKQFEYKYVYNMPEKKTISWDAIRLGSFVHLVLEKGVKENYKDVKQFVDYAKELHLEEDWESVELKEAEHLIKVFFARNKGKYNEKSRTEQFLKANIDGFDFIGFADRIDYHDDWIEIIDYKTGKTIIDPRSRNWQLGYYALAASRFGKVRKITLDMLKHDSPLEFEVDDQGNARSVNSTLEFNIYDIELELIDTAKAIDEAYKSGFKPCPLEKNCDFCNEYVYNL